MSDLHDAPQVGRRRPYQRPMGGWWRRNPFFIRYMAREATALVVAAYALFLLTGLLSLARGEQAYAAWRALLDGPLAIAVNLLGLVVMLYHSWTWFEIMPKTLPPVCIGGKRVGPAAITGAGVCAALVASAALLLLAWRIA